ncbi:phospholipase A1-II 1-like [Hibiscus syriacus]|uniref:phospholipase A1-II 1-like n=1 Tax=Hibiscus syriacus TaxID=106335 RepID=UPI001921378D|nr:phospholipase A1-II 1-like [Hibiscus syriacus]
MDRSIARRWRELSGEDNWKSLLQPLDPDLRRYIIHYGQMTGAAVDLFNGKTLNPNASKEDFFSEACLVKGNPYKYEVTRFIYAGSDSVKSAWIGYVAVATDEGRRVLGRRDILVAWRGTRTKSEWLNNFRVGPRVSASQMFPDRTKIQLHRGFYFLYTGTRPDSIHNKTSAREQVLEAVKELVDKYQNDTHEEMSITVTGFSLGAALATLTAMDIAANGYNKPPKGEPFMVTAFTFGGPRVGNDGLKRVFNTLGLDHLRLLRIKNEKDFIPNMPPLIFTGVGNKLVVNTSVSKYLNFKVFCCAVRLQRQEEEDNTWRWLRWLCIVLLVAFMVLQPNGDGDGDELDRMEYEDEDGDGDELDRMEYEDEELDRQELIIMGSEDGDNHEIKCTEYHDDHDYGDQHDHHTIMGSEDGDIRKVICMFSQAADPRQSVYIDTSKLGENYSCHNMDVYLHGVAIKDIADTVTAEELDHDIALVNKYFNRVLPDYEIPPRWWKGENRRMMVQLDNGRWKVELDQT